MMRNQPIRESNSLENIFLENIKKSENELNLYRDLEDKIFSKFETRDEVADIYVRKLVSGILDIRAKHIEISGQPSIKYKKHDGEFDSQEHFEIFWYIISRLPNDIIIKADRKDVSRSSSKNVSWIGWKTKSGDYRRVPYGIYYAVYFLAKSLEYSAKTPSAKNS